MADFTASKIKEVQDNRAIGEAGQMLLLFALLCLVTSFAFNFNKGKQKTVHLSIHELSRTGGLSNVIPLEVKGKNSVYTLKIKQNYREMVSNRDYSSVTTIVKDNRDKFLYQLDQDFYKESGYDSDGSWSDSKTSYKKKLTFRKPGTYMIQFKVATSNWKAGDITIFIKPKIASSLPMLVLGIFSFIISLLLFHVQNKRDEASLINN